MKNFYLAFSLMLSLVIKAQLTTIVSFTGGVNGAMPHGKLYYDGTYLYGTTVHGGTNNLGTIYKIKTDGSGFTKLLDFTGALNGSFPWSSLISDGNYLYGMTYMGGLSDSGTVYKIKPDGSGYTKLLDLDMNTGKLPQGDLYFDGTYLYGMTTAGGVNQNCGYYGCGVVFRIKPDGSSYTKLMDFNGTNGAEAVSSFISDGTYLYAMTGDGGANGIGNVFKIKSDGSGYATVLDFSGFDGEHPWSSLCYDGVYLYGTTFQGGANNEGVIFKVKPDGSGYLKLLDFNVTNGDNPWATLYFDGTYLYGTTGGGGANNEGVVFKILPNGTGYINMFDFTATDGSPISSLISDGTYMYGTTLYSYGQTNDSGTVFKIGLNSVAGIHHNHNDQIRIWPNPAKTSIYVELFSRDETIFCLVDVFGNELMNVNSKQGITYIDVSDLADGVYFVKSHYGVQKFIKQ